MSDIADLIARVEAAQGPDRELDAEIHALGLTVDSRLVIPRAYTASLDAAAALVPDGGDWSRHRGVNGQMTMQVWGPDAMWPGLSQAATPALALCAAALRARMARDG